MIVCVCNRISDREIARHAHAGMSFDDIQLELGVATVCGNCERCARDVVEQCSSSHPACAVEKTVAAHPHTGWNLTSPSLDTPPRRWLRLGVAA